MQLLETIRAEGGSCAHLAYHRARMQRSLTYLGCENVIDPATVLAPPKEGLIRCRLIYDCAGVVSLSYHPYTPRVVRTLRLIEANTLDYRLKYADRSALDALFEKRGDADDILIVQNGLVTDTTIANIAFFDGGRWLTPQRPLLEGTTRSRLLDEGRLTAADISVADAKGFRGFALMNAMTGFVVIEDGIIR